MINKIRNQAQLQLILKHHNNKLNDPRCYPFLIVSALRGQRTRERRIIGGNYISRERMINERGLGKSVSKISYPPPTHAHHLSPTQTHILSLDAKFRAVAWFTRRAHNNFSYIIVTFNLRGLNADKLPASSDLSQTTSIYARNIRSDVRPFPLSVIIPACVRDRKYIYIHDDSGGVAAASLTELFPTRSISSGYNAERARV